MSTATQLHHSDRCDQCHKKLTGRDIGGGRCIRCGSMICAVSSNDASSAETEREERIEVALIKGVEGYCVAVNDYRICGSKPWGGGSVVQSWKTTKEDVLRAFLTPDQKHEWLAHDLRVMSEQSYVALVVGIRRMLAEAEFVADAKAPLSTWIAEQCRSLLRVAGEEV